MSTWHVMKFGGSSLADLSRVKQVVGIVAEQVAHGPVALVVSAPGDSTDRLTRCFQAALEDRRDDVAHELRSWKTWLQGFAMDDGFDPAHAFRGALAELEDILSSISACGDDRERIARLRDYVLSTGERLSVRLVSTALRNVGLPAIAVDARETDDFTGELIISNLVLLRVFA